MKCLLAFDYPADLLEIMVVNDGSDDATASILDELARRDARVRAIHRPPGAPAGSRARSNRALDDATGDVIVVFDADHKPRADVLRRLVRHFADPRTAAVQGRCIVRNSNESKLAQTIAVDYYCGYLVNEYGRQSLYDLPAYGGANCAVRASTLRAFGGWNEETVTEDTDLTLRLVLAGLRGAVRRHRDRHRGERLQLPALLAPAVPVGARAPARVARVPPLGLARAGPVVRAAHRDHDVPARVPRAGRVRASAPRSSRCAVSASSRGARASTSPRSRPSCSSVPCSSSAPG